MARARQGEQGVLRVDFRVEAQRCPSQPAAVSAQATLAANLLCPDYVQVVCGTLDQLPQAFAALDRKAINSTTPEIAA